MSRRDRMESAKRVLPHNLEAEASVLGGVILRNDALTVVPDLEVEAFYDNRHKVVFQAIRNLEALSMPIDVVTLENEVNKAGKLDAIGGVAFIGDLTLRVPTVDNIEIYGKIVQTKHLTRSVMLAISDMLDEAYMGESEGEQLVHDVTTAMMLIGSHRDEPIVTIAELVAREAQTVLRDMERRAAGELVFAGVPTGIEKIDMMVGGHPIGIPTLYIARPATAKTTMAMQFARTARELASPEQVARGGGMSLLASYEDAGQSFGQRALAHESGLSTELLRARKLTPDDMVSLMAGWAASGLRTELLLSASGMGVEALVRRVRRENVRRKSRGLLPLAQVIVDYIQKIPQPEYARSRDEGIGYISQHLAAMAVRENCALVEMCQLNRDVEKRDDHEPRLSDIRDSGTLDQDGKFVVGLYRPWNYAPTKHHPTELHALILKNHNGQNGLDIPLYWDLKSHAIYNNELEYQAARSVRLRRAIDHQQQAR